MTDLFSLRPTLERDLLNQIVDQASQEFRDVDLRLSALAKENLLLRTVVEVLVTRMRESDPEIDTRIANALAELANPSTYTCIRCKRKVSPAATVMTATGPLCDPRCAAT